MDSGATASFDPIARLRLDHRRVLSSVQQLESSALATHAPVDESAVRAFAELLSSQFASHMEVEDRLLYPLLVESAPELRLSLAPLALDHAELRALLHDLVQRLDARPSPGRDEQLRVSLRDLVDLLRLHVRHEETVVLDLASRVLGPDALTSVFQQLTLLSSPDQGGRVRPTAKGTPS